MRRIAKQRIRGRLGRVLALLALAGAAAPLHAYRPLATDDASVNPRGVCQLETWHERGDETRGWVFAPACGLGANLEFALEASRVRPVAEDRGGWGAQLKGVLPVTPGGWALGWKAGTFVRRNPAARDGKPDAWQAIGIATRELGGGWTAHMNLGGERDVAESRSLAIYGAALMHTFGERGFVFGELVGDHRSGAVRTLGARAWLIHERLGVDLTASRQAGVPGSTVWTIGLSYYGFSAFD